MAWSYAQPMRKDRPVILLNAVLSYFPIETAVKGAAVDPVRQEFERRLARKIGVEVYAWKGGDLICLSFNGKEFAHFHGQTILDIRLTPKTIREYGLSRSVSKRVHPPRSENSKWIAVEFASMEDLDKMEELVDLACSELNTA